MSTSRSRAYILLESMVTGAMVAVLLMMVIQMLSAARDDEVRAARRAIASDIALGELARVQARGYGGLVAGTTQTVVQPPNGGRYLLTTRLAQGTESVGVPAPTGITVNVRYLDVHIEVAFGTPARTSVVQGRVYEARLD